MGFVVSLQGLGAEACQGLLCLSFPWPVRSFVTFGLAATAIFLTDQLAIANLIYFSLSLYGATQVS